MSTNSAIDPPSLSGRRFSLVPLIPTHHLQLYNMSVVDTLGFRWRFRGNVPPFPIFEQSLHANVFLQLALVPNEDPTRLAGLLVAYNANMQDQTAYIGVISDRQLGIGTIEGTALFLRYLFVLWPFRKLYFEVPEYNVTQFASAVDTGLLKEEGRLRSDHYYHGKYWDLIIFTIYGDDLEQFAAQNSNLLPE